MLSAAVFDMDGLMIDSEPYWRQAQLEVFLELGVPINAQDTVDTTGIRIDQVVNMYLSRTSWDSMSCQQVCDNILERVIDLVREHKPVMPGLFQALELCKQQGLKLALASSSPMALIAATVDALELTDVFEATLSAEHLRFGKPHPEVYLNACDALEVPPRNCVALEDSFNGLLAAKAAQMKTIAIPDASVKNQPHFVIADRILASLEEVTQELLQSLDR
jgi:sugar-phosphatase